MAVTTKGNATMPRTREIRIEVKDQAEGESIERALTDPMTRAFIVIVGTLLPFGSRTRTRILTFVNDKLDEAAGTVTIETQGGQHHVAGALPQPEVKAPKTTARRLKR